MNSGLTQHNTFFVATLWDRWGGKRCYTTATVETDKTHPEPFHINAIGAKTPSGPCAMASKPSSAQSTTGRAKSLKSLRLEALKAGTGGNTNALKDFTWNKSLEDWESSWRQYLDWQGCRWFVQTWSKLKQWKCKTHRNTLWKSHQITVWVLLCQLSNWSLKN